MPLLKWALIFLVISIIAGLLGFTGVSIVSADIARTLFYVFLVIFIVLLVLGLLGFPLAACRCKLCFPGREALFPMPRLRYILRRTRIAPWHRF